MQPVRKKKSVVFPLLPLPYPPTSLLRNRRPANLVGPVVVIVVVFVSFYEKKRAAPRCAYVPTTSPGGSCGAYRAAQIGPGVPRQLLA